MRGVFGSHPSCPSLGPAPAKAAGQAQPRRDGGGQCRAAREHGADVSAPFPVAASREILEVRVGGGGSIWREQRRFPGINHLRDLGRIYVLPGPLFFNQPFLPKIYF